MNDEGMGNERNQTTNRASKVNIEYLVWLGNLLTEDRIFQILFPYDKRIQQVSCILYQLGNLNTVKDFGANKKLTGPVTVRVKSAN